MGNIEIYIRGFELDGGKLTHHCDEEFELSLGYATCRSLRISELRIRCECLYLDEEWTVPLYSEGKCRACKLRTLRIDELHPRIREVDKSLFFHTKESNIIRWSESVLEGSEDSIVFSSDSFEEKYNINKMFKRFRSADRSILGNMSDEDDRFSHLFCDIHTHLCHDTYL